MSDFTRILSQIESGDPSAAEQLLPLVYDELRKLAAEKMAQEKSGQTLQAKALVHEAYIRLVDVERPSIGTRVPTSSPLRPKPCDESLWSGPRNGGRSPRAAINEWHCPTWIRKCTSHVSTCSL